MPFWVQQDKDRWWRIYHTNQKIWWFQPVNGEEHRFRTREEAERYMRILDLMSDAEKRRYEEMGDD